MPSADYFLDLIRKSRRGKFKVYIGMSAGVGKTYRMLQEAHVLLGKGVNVVIGYIETHQRAETQALLDGLPIVPRRSVFYKGKSLEELDVQAVLNMHPEVVVVDELAHSNVPGSKNEKRWQDVLEILEAGISVISAVNIQHLESLNIDVLGITGVEVMERIPDSVLRQADEVVNIDLTADELITRLKEGKIYTADKVPMALKHFFKADNILQLRELALREVATQVERKVATEVLPVSKGIRIERFLACISSNDKTARHIIRKTARLANYYNSQWFVLYVQTSVEASDKIPLATQRHLINNFETATQLGATLLQVKSEKVAESIAQTAEDYTITTICIGKPHLSLWRIILAGSVFNQLLKKMSSSDIDLIILS
jgi:two-component system sensor histidine kinase KdpD